MTIGLFSLADWQAAGWLGSLTAAVALGLAGQELLRSRRDGEGLLAMTKCAKYALTLAHKSAWSKDRTINVIGILVGVLRAHGSACGICARLGISPEVLAAKIESEAPKGHAGTFPFEQYPLTQDAEGVLRAARQGATDLGSHLVSTGHLLLAILENDSAIAILCEDQGLTAGKVRTELREGGHPATAEHLDSRAMIRSFLRACMRVLGILLVLSGISSLAVPTIPPTPTHVAILGCVITTALGVLLMRWARRMSRYGKGSWSGR